MKTVDCFGQATFSYVAGGKWRCLFNETEVREGTYDDEDGVRCAIYVRPRSRMLPEENGTASLTRPKCGRALTTMKTVAYISRTF